MQYEDWIPILVALVPVVGLLLLVWLERRG